MPQEPFLDDFIKYGSFSKIEIFLGYFRVRSLKNLGSTFFKQSLVRNAMFEGISDFPWHYLNDE